MRAISIVILLSIGYNVYAQNIDEMSSEKYTIGYYKTMHIIFPADIKYFSSGNENIMAERVEKQKNILRIMSTINGFKGETNLSIVTADSKFYSYSFTFNENMKQSYLDLNKDYICPHTLAISTDKLVSIIFPSKVIYENHGSDKIIVRKANGINNILTVKAKDPFAQESNISVVTEEGKFYTFNLHCGKNPEINTFIVDREDHEKIAILDEGELNTEQKAAIRAKVEEELKLPLKLKEEISKIKLEINNIFIHKDILLLRMTITNNSPINYTIDFMRLYIQDAKKSKKTAIQQLEQPLLFTFDYPQEVEAYNSTTFVAAINKLTIPDKKRLIIEIQEKNGGRHFFFKLKNKNIMRAQELKTKVDKETAEAEEILEKVMQ